MKYLLPIFIFILFLNIDGVEAQDEAVFKKLIEKTESYYKNKNQYSLLMKYDFIETGKTTPTESIDGVIYRKENDFYKRIDNTEEIVIGNSFLRINHHEKAMSYEFIDKAPSTSPIDLASLLIYFDKIKVEKKAQEIMCMLSFKKGFGLPYTKMLLKLDANTSAILSQEIFMNQPLPYANLVTEKQKSFNGSMIITLTEDTNYITDPSLFTEKNYIQRGDKIAPSKKWSHYEFFNITL